MYGVYIHNLSPGVNQIAAGQSDVVVAGGVDFMSDVPIRVSRGLRKTLLTMNKTKGTMARLGVLTRNTNAIVSLDW